MNDTGATDPPTGDGVTAAVAALRRAGAAHQLLRYGGPEPTKVAGIEAAELLGLDPAAVLKTLGVDAGGDLVLALVPVSARLDLEALATLLGSGTRLARPAVVEETTGSVLGAISPLGHAPALPCVIDASVQGRSRAYVSGGRHGLELGLAPEVLIEVTGATVATIARPVTRDASAPRE